ncbi:hypothetical protein HELRODRAFT_187554 [Helobdella robusta]|uniref:60S ribosomal export protein NMD3 n=1 Tax=Helobdella robusta TaxID=6412 RepID=T1FPA7_HELRO|nr:hypothetical protein HELRODRAFT_187554 [Helobdella robusta]ESN92424.1 hypothetical protein HELRODRAFT_187554 [Helobdella robusta]
MEYMPEEENPDSANHPSEAILCCECGIPIVPNPANTCVNCLKNRVGISDDIPKQYTLYFCRNCERYLQPPNSWVKASLESRELLALCLKRIKGIDKSVRLVDAGFSWTEPHSKRLKVKITIQKEVMQGAILQEKLLIEYVVNNQMCDDCHRVEAKDYWRACVQIRQRTSHKKTLYYLEQLILKHKAHLTCSNVKQVHEGLDFYYQNQQEARKMVDFLQAVVPCRSNTAKELISHDQKSNIYNYKHTFCVEVVPLCKDNVVCLTPQFARQLGNIGQLCVVFRVTSMIYIIDPTTCKSSVIRSDVYWRNPVLSICHPKQLTEFIVTHCELLDDRHSKEKKGGQGWESNKHNLGHVWLTKTSELGEIGHQQYQCRTHLGRILKPGDTVLGFDLKNMNINDDNFEKMNPKNLPEVILIKKLFGKRASRRMWKLKHITDDVELDAGSSAGRDFNDFLDDLEEDEQYRKNINIYRDKTKSTVPKTDQSDDDEEIPVISLAEMIDELHIGEDATGGEGADMIE